MDKTLVTIVSASFNSEAYIRKAIESVLHQTYSNIEYLIIDGDSKDRTLEILKSYGEKIKWFSEKDDGIYDALNKGFNAARGHVLTWLDTDNYYLSNNVIEKVIAEFEKDKNLEMVVANTKIVYDGGFEEINYAPENPSFAMFLSKGNKFVPEGVFFRRFLFEKVGGFDIQYKLLADYELWLKMLRLKPKIKKLNIVSAVFTIRQNSLLRKDPFLAWQETYKIGKKYGWRFSTETFFQIRFLIERLKFLIVKIFKKQHGD